MSTEEDRLAHFEHGDAIEVPVGKIERELDALWRQAAVHAKGRPITRACLWNLIVRAAGDAQLKRAKKLVDELSASVPVRAIVLHVEDQTEPGPVRAWVEANWRPSGKGASGSDEVTLAAAGRVVERLPALVRSLVITDVPTAMLWLDGPPAAGLPLEGLLDEVERLIIDTRKFPDEASLVSLSARLQKLPSLEAVDLAWLGVGPLRGLCASLFDPPRDPARLDSLDRVRVASGVSGTQSRALLTLGWLMARLGWKRPKKVAGEAGLRRWRCPRKDGGEVELELETRTGAPDHGVVELRLEAGADVWSLTRDRCIDVRSPDLPARMQPARSHADAELIVEALGPRGRDPVYRDALTAAAELVAAS